MPNAALVLVPVPLVQRIRDRSFQVFTPRQRAQWVGIGDEDGGRSQGQGGGQGQGGRSERGRGRDRVEVAIDGSIRAAGFPRASGGGAAARRASGLLACRHSALRSRSFQLLESAPRNGRWLLFSQPELTISERDDRPPTASARRWPMARRRQGRMHLSPHGRRVPRRSRPQSCPSTPHHSFRGLHLLPKPCSACAAHHLFREGRVLRNKARCAAPRTRATKDREGMHHVVEHLVDRGGGDVHARVEGRSR